MTLKKWFLFGFIFFCSEISSAQIKILFDASKAEMAGNADWVIDADQHNLGSNSSGLMLPGFGSESNPQRFPTPAQSGITASTPETYWEGSLSNWAIDMVKHGYEVETLPYNASITYGNSSNVQDLSNYKVFIIDEPNIQFTAAEKTALIHFVQNGGGLFMISDHTVSDRNGDGWDSPAIWNDLFSTNSVQADPFGITFDLQNISQTSSNIANLPSDSCLHGPMGNVTAVKYSNGTTMTLSTAANSTVKGLIYKTGASNSGTTQILFSRARYGNGKVCAFGDSSPPDDSTGDPNDQLYNSYIGEVNGSHQKLLVNATIWLATTDSLALSVNESENNPFNLTVYPNPSSGKINVDYFLKSSDDVRIEVSDISGRVVLQSENKFLSAGKHQQQFSCTGTGFYFVRMITGNYSEVKRVVIE